MCEISIIVPVYNVEKYLHKCVDSILAQTFTDFEVILVDDGSPDNSGAICDEYAKKDNRVKVIHKENGGLSDARNAGIEVAQGNYLGFVDSDDYIAVSMYETLYDNIVKYNADLSICGIYDVYKGKEPQILESFHKLCTKEETIKIILDSRIVGVHAVNKLYKKNLFENIRYPLGKLVEDAAIILDILDLCKNIIIDSEQKYYYFHRENSITSNQFSINDLDFIEAWIKNEMWISKKYPQFKYEAHTRVCWAHFMVLDKIVLSEKQPSNTVLAKEIRTFLLQNFYFILKNSRLTIGRKLSMLFLFLGLKFYQIPVKLQYKKIQAAN